jgi:hypothetical protein
MRARHAVVLLPLLLFTAQNAAADPRSVKFLWEARSFPDSCMTSELAHQGQANFEVNQFPIPTYTLELSSDKLWGRHHAPFRTSLFRIGENSLYFAFSNAGGTQECNKAHDIVHLVGLSSQPKLLFNVLTMGTDYEGVTDIDVSLREIDAELADSIERLRRDLRDRIAELQETGDDADRAVAEDIERMENLLEDLDELLSRGFDQISLEELDSLLQEYTDLLPGLYDELQQVIEDFQTVIEDLRQEIDRISQEFRDWADQLPDFSDSGGGFEDGDFEVGEDGMPEVEVPDVLGDEPFDENHDPYDEYADEVIASLATTLDPTGEIVANRTGFLDIFAAWRINIHQIEIGLQSRATLDQEEYGAFLRSIQKVLTFTQRFLDENNWFRDSQVDPETRQLVDIALMGWNPSRAERIKAALNAFTALDGGEAAAVFGILFYLKELGIAVQQARNEVERQRRAQQEESFWDSVTGFLSTAASIGWEAAIAVTPLGDLIDACEAITGKAGCNVVSGRDLTWEERAFSAAGILMWGSAHSIRQLASKMDDIACRVRPGAAVAPLAIPCTTAQFFSRLNQAIDDVPKRTPRQDLARTISHADGSKTYVRTDGTEVFYNKKGFPEFEPQHMWPVPGQREVLVEFRCDRAWERSEANRLSQIPPPGAPDTYTWHHAHKFLRVNGKVMVKMQLVRKTVHDWAQHTGGYGIGKTVVGAAACR